PRSAPFPYTTRFRSATRIAISPRFAIRSRRNIAASASERDVPVLLRRTVLSLRPEDGERVDHSRTRLLGLDDVIEVSHPRRDVWVRESLSVLPDEFLLALLRI